MIKARIVLIIAFLLLLSGRTAVFSQTADKSEVISSEETLYKGEMKSVPVNTPTRVVIGKPDVADILSVTTKEVVVVGKGPGSTNLIWWDELGEHHINLKVLTEDMAFINSRIKELIKELNMPQISTQPSDSEGKVLLLGSVKTAEELERIKTALGGLVPKTTNLIKIEEEKAIIELEVEIIEVDKGSTRNMGMDWLLSGGSATYKEPVGRWPKLANLPDSLFRVSEWTHTQLEATLNLLIEEGKAKILSRPKLACQSGKEAELLVGGEKPVMTTQVISGGANTSNTIEYKEYGIKLKMSPTLNADGKIKLVLNVEVTDVGDAEVLGAENSPTAKAWPLTKRSTSTELYLNDRQTLAISGLIKQKTEEQLQRFPWLSDVPILGVFFRKRNTQKGSGKDTLGDTELIVMITPAVVQENALEKKDSPKKSKSGSFGEKPAASQGAAVTKAGKNALLEPEIASQTSNKGIIVSQEMPFSAKAAPTRKIPFTQEDVSLSGNEGNLPRTPTEAYTRQIMAYLKNNIFYPWAAKQGELEGTVVLNLHLSKSGELLASDIEKTSGYSVLDENAMRTARQIIPYPSFPKQIADKDLWVKIPVVYELEAKE